MATTSAGLGLEEISSKLNANGRKKRTPKTVEDAQQIEQSEDILRYGGSGKGRKFLYGVAAAIVGEDNAKKVAKKYGNREEQEKAFENIYGKEKKSRKQNKTTEQIPKSELKDYLEQLKQSLDDISDIKDILERIEKRVSPRDVTIGKGVQAQTYRFDPLAPLEKQVTEVNETGLAGSFAGKKETAAVLSKAAYFGNKDLVSKKEQQDKKLGITPEPEKESDNKKAKKVERKANVKQTVQKVQPIEIKEIIKEIKNQFKITNKLIRDTANKNKTKISQSPKPQSQNFGKPKFNTFQEYEENQNKLEEAKDTVKYGGTSFGKKFVYGFRQQLLGDKYAQRKARENANKEQREEALRLLNPSAFQSKQSLIQPTENQIQQKQNIQPTSQTQIDKMQPTTDAQAVNNNTTTVLESKIDTIIQATKEISEVKDGVERIEKRVSPRDINIGKGADEQTYRFDPLAPEGKQVTEVQESGLAGGVASKEGGARSDYQKVLSKAAYLGNEDLITKKEQEDKLKNSQDEITPTEETVPSAPFVQAAVSETSLPLVTTPTVEPAPAPEIKPVLPETSLPLVTSPTVEPAQVVPPTLPPPLPQPTQLKTPNFIKKLQEQADKLSQSKFIKGLEEKVTKLAETSFVKGVKKKSDELTEKAANSNFVKNLQNKAQEISDKISETPFVKKLKSGVQELTSPATSPAPVIPSPINIEVPEQIQSVQEVTPEQAVVEQPTEQQEQTVADIKATAQTSIPNIEPSITESQTSKIKNTEVDSKLNQVINSTKQIPEISDAVSRVEKRVSPRDITTGKGDESQTYRFDPLAPEGKQVTEVKESGLAGSFADKTTSASVLSKAAYLGNQDLTEKKQQQDLRKEEQLKVQAPEVPVVPEIQAPEVPVVPEIQAPEVPVVPEIQAPEVPVVPEIQAPEVQAQRVQVIPNIETIEQPNPTTTPQLETKVDQIIQSTKNLPEVKDSVDRIEKRVSPRDINVGKGKDEQTYRFDPLAPEGKQVTEVKESGLAGSFAGKKEEAAVLSKAAYLGNQDMVDKKEQQDLRKTEEDQQVSPPVEVKPAAQPELKQEQKEKTLEQRQTENEEKTNKLIKEVKEQLIVTNKLIVSSKTIGQSLKPGQQQQGQGKQKFASGEEFEAHQEEVEKAKDIVKFGGTGFAKKFAFGFKEKLLGEKFARKSAAKNSNKEEREKALRLLNPDKIQPAEQGAAPPPLPGAEPTQQSPLSQPVQETPNASSSPQGSDLMRPAVTPPAIQPTQTADPSGNTSEAENAQTVSIQRDAAEAQQEDREKIISQLEKIDKKIDELLQKEDSKGGILSGIAKVLGVAALAEGAAAAAGGLAAAGTAALPALAVAGAGAAGYIAGKGIDKGVEAVTGRAASDWSASGVGAITGQNAEGNQAAHAGESSFKQRAETMNSKLKGTGYELVAPGKYKGPDGKIVSKNELPAEVKDLTKAGAMPNAQGVIEGKIERGATKPEAAAAPPAAITAPTLEAPKAAPAEQVPEAKQETKSSGTEGEQPKVEQPQVRTSTLPVVPSAVAATGAVSSESKEKQQQEKITTLTTENTVLKQQAAATKRTVNKVPRVQPPTPPQQQKKERKEDTTIIQIRNVEQSVATYTASIFDHPVVHPGIYKM